LLRSKGVKAEVPRPRVEPAPAPAPAPELPAVVTSAFRDGEHLIWYPRLDEEGRVDVYQAQASEVEGLEKFEAYNCTRRQYRELERSIITETKLPVARVPHGWARWLIEEAAHRTQALGHSLPRPFTEVRARLEAPEEPRPHPALVAISDEAIARALDEGPERALLVPETQSWIPEESAARRAFEEMRALAESPLVLDEHVRLERLRAIVDREAGETMRGPFRQRLARRLLDTAYFIIRLAESEPPTSAASKRDYAHDAALCAAAARHVLDDTVPLDENKVARALFARLLEGMQRAPEPAEPPRAGGGLLINP
jgi:hypothetical protein